MGALSTANNILVRKVGKPEGNRAVGRPMHVREDNIKMYLKIGCEGMDWIHIAQCRVRWRTLVNMVMNPRIS
jgi:hypothetical protein